MKSYILITAMMASIGCAAAADGDSFRLKGFVGKKLAILDNTTIGAAASDVHGAHALNKFDGSASEMDRRITSGVLTTSSLDKLHHAEIVAKRRQAVLDADFWVVPINSAGMGIGQPDYELHRKQFENLGRNHHLADLEFSYPVYLDSRFSPAERRNRLMTTGDMPGVMICNEKTAEGACVHLTNIDGGINPLPKWVVPTKNQLHEIWRLADRDANEKPINAAYAVIVRPTNRQITMVNGMPAIQGEVIQGVLINTLSMTPILRFNQDYKQIGKANPLIAF